MGLIPDTSDLHERQDEQAYLADVARRLRDKAPLTLETDLLEGDVVAALKEYVREQAIDLVVIATHARGPFARFWVGSVADDLGAEITQPVLLVRPGEGKPDLAREAPLRSIVVPLDGSEMAERALWPAAELAQLFDAELALVRVNPPALLPAYLPEGAAARGLAWPLVETEQVERQQREEAQTYLAQVASMLVVRGVRCRTDVVLEVRPAAGILADADALHADLIAIETHGRRGLARFFFGSVADEVVRGGEVPVLVHHAAD
jgi:nucleotide-binding universal stress UspA family protein